MTGIPTTPGTWHRELQRSRQSLSAVNEFWQGLYGKAVLSPAELLPPSGVRGADGASATPPTSPARSMYERVGSRVIDS